MWKYLPVGPPASCGMQDLFLWAGQLYEGYRFSAVFSCKFLTVGRPATGEEGITGYGLSAVFQL